MDIAPRTMQTRFRKPACSGLLIVALLVAVGCDCIYPITGGRIDRINECVDWHDSVTVGCSNDMNPSAAAMMSCMKHRETGEHVCMTSIISGDYYPQWMQASDEICAICYLGSDCE